EKPGEPPKHAKGLKESAMAGSKRKLSQTSEDKRDDGLTRKLAGFLRAIKALADPYRPELHYMRGPGPKYHAKHNGSRESIDDRTPPLVCDDSPVWPSRSGSPPAAQLCKVFDAGRLPYHQQIVVVDIAQPRLACPGACTMKSDHVFARIYLYTQTKENP